MYEKYTAEYFLGPDFQKNSSVLKPFADALVRSQDSCGLDVAQANFFLLFVQYSNMFKLLSGISEKAGVGSENPSDEYTRKQLAAQFREICTLQEDVSELNATLINQCADMIAGKF